MKVVKRNVGFTLMCGDTTDRDNLVHVFGQVFDSIYRAQERGTLRWKPRGRKWDFFETKIGVLDAQSKPHVMRVVLWHTVFEDKSELWRLTLGSTRTGICHHSHDPRVRRLVNRVAGPEHFPEVA